MATIKNIKTSQTTLNNKLLEKYINAINRKYGEKYAESLLPISTKYIVDFEIHNTNSGFANAVRRSLHNIFTLCLDLQMSDIETNDDFISGISDALVKNINLIPINQESEIFDKEQIDNLHNNSDIHDYHSEFYDDKVKQINIKYNITMNVYNDTPNIIDVLVSNFNITTMNKQPVANNLLFIEPNSVVVRLRPGKFLNLKNIKIIAGHKSYDAGKFTLLNNIRYKPLDVNNFNQFDKTGERSIISNPTKFHIGFTTTGNISPKRVIQLTQNYLLNRLITTKQKITDFIEACSKNKDITHYKGNNYMVDITDAYHLYKFNEQYLTEVNMISRQCYELDKSIIYCTSGVDRYDSEHAFIKLKHPNPNKLLIDSIDICIANVNKIFDEPFS